MNTKSPLLLYLVDDVAGIMCKSSSLAKFVTLDYCVGNSCGLAGAIYDHLGIGDFSVNFYKVTYPKWKPLTSLWKLWPLYQINLFKKSEHIQIT